MNKQDFLAVLQAELSGIPQDDIEERIGFYSEMIDDRVEEGLSEEQAVEELGTVESITQQIMAEIPLTKLVKEKVKPGRTLKVWEIVLLALGSPIWLSLLIAFFAIVLSVYAVICCVTLALWAIEAAFVACFIGGVVAAVVFITQGTPAPGILMIGVGLIGAGLAILGFFGCKYATAGILKLTKRILLWIKSCFIKKGAQNE